MGKAKKPKAKKKKKKKKKKAKKKKKKKKKKKAKKVKYVGGKRAKGQHKSKASIAGARSSRRPRRARASASSRSARALRTSRRSGLEEHDAPGGGQGRLGVHQEERPEQGAHREGGREDLRRRLDVQARGRHCQAHEVSALVVWSWIPCRSHRAPAEAVSDVLSRGFSGDRE